MLVSQPEEIWGYRFLNGTLYLFKFQKKYHRPLLLFNIYQLLEKCRVFLSFLDFWNILLGGRSI